MVFDRPVFCVKTIGSLKYYQTLPKRCRNVWFKLTLYAVFQLANSFQKLTFFAKRPPTFWVVICHGSSQNTY